VATAIFETESLATFSVVFFSVGGVHGVGCFVLPHWQFAPHLQAPSWPPPALQQHEFAGVALREAQQQRPSRTFFVAQQQLSDRSFF
jgi:hypothetical protein